VLDLPTRIGPYEVVEHVNTGGMAHVYRAVRRGVTDFKRDVALKLILPHLAQDPEFIQMFQQEAKLAAQLHHSKICQIFMLDRFEDTYFMAMEYIHGRDTGAIYGRSNQLGAAVPIGALCAIILDVCEALDYAHHKLGADDAPLNLIHRDVSPANVLVGFEGATKLIDFGLAKAASSAHLTRAGQIKGKLAYLSPEQLVAGPLDGRSDLYAFGIVLWELATGRRLFKRDSDVATFEAVRAREIPGIRGIRPDIPEQIERVILRALQVDPDERYEFADDMRRDVLQYMYSQPTRWHQSDVAKWMSLLFS
jgi:serine/threonine protein kinase